MNNGSFLVFFDRFLLSAEAYLGFFWLVHDDSEAEGDMRKNNFTLPSFSFWLVSKKWWTKGMRWLWLDLFHNDGNDNYSDDDGSNSADTASECDDGSVWDDDGNDTSVVFVGVEEDDAGDESTYGIDCCF